jgi:hypothetical protein
MEKTKQEAGIACLALNTVSDIMQYMVVQQCMCRAELYKFALARVWSAELYPDCVVSACRCIPRLVLPIILLQKSLHKLDMARSVTGGH